MLTCHESSLEPLSPQAGWVEFEPLALWATARVCLETAVQNLIILDINPHDIVAVGVCNQRETTVLWDRTTGKPLCNAIGWCDTRTSSVVGSILQRVRGKKHYLKSVCGLTVSNCFSAVKLRWMMEHVDGVQRAMDEGRAAFGTLDSWIIWMLTGGVEAGIHVTDVTNASRTMLMNLERRVWDERLCRFFRIPSNILPEIRSCSEVYGYINEGPLSGTPIASVWFRSFLFGPYQHRSHLLIAFPFFCSAWAISRLPCSGKCVWARGKPTAPSTKACSCCLTLPGRSSIPTMGCFRPLRFS